MKNKLYEWIGSTNFYFFSYIEAIAFAFPMQLCVRCSLTITLWVQTTWPIDAIVYALEKCNLQVGMQAFGVAETKKANEFERSSEGTAHRLWLTIEQLGQCVHAWCADR